jgi:hypothetical protein
VNLDSIVQMVSKDMVKGMNIKRSPGDTNHECDTCIQAKQHVQSYPKVSERKYLEVGDMTYTDIWGPSRTTGCRKERYYISFTDGFSSHRVILFMVKKSEAYQKIKQYKEFVLTQRGKRCKVFRFDQGREYVADKTIELLSNEGIRVEITAPYSHEQIGIAECLNRTVIEKVRAMLISHSLPLFLWPDAITYAIYLINCTPTNALFLSITPHEGFWGVKPDIS